MFGGFLNTPGYYNYFQRLVYNMTEIKDIKR